MRERLCRTLEAHESTSEAHSTGRGQVPTFSRCVLVLLECAGRAADARHRFVVLSLPLGTKLDSRQEMVSEPAGQLRSHNSSHAEGHCVPLLPVCLAQSLPLIVIPVFCLVCRVHQLWRLCQHVQLCRGSPRSTASTSLRPHPRRRMRLRPRPLQLTSACRPSWPPSARPGGLHPSSSLQHPQPRRSLSPQPQCAS